MLTRIRVAVLAAGSTVAMLAAVAPSAHAGLLSLSTGSCGAQEYQPFTPWGDNYYYVKAPGGDFESGASGWALTGGASVVSGNESFNVAGGSHSLSLPAGSSATSPTQCTGIDHPDMRFFVRNTGSSSSRLKVYATYPLLLGLPYTAYLGEVSGSPTWQPSSAVQIGLLNNTIGSLTLGESTISFTFVPADSTGHWQIDDVYLDPFHRC
ncbi:MAG TPA: hypothetical protein VKR21_18555 [Solirubrobacteraceae bacterium]|nr:hypothetical protein [Solirubrobacteraceae bacterium]